MSMDDKIKNVKSLTTAFSRFPTFHDAEVFAKMAGNILHPPMTCQTYSA